MTEDKRKSLGLVHNYTGNGKGKTTAALGLALRALEHGLSVHILQFLKGGTYAGELKAPEKYNGCLCIEQFGKGNDEEPQYKDFTPDQQDRSRALAGLKRAEELLAQETTPDVLVLDEINVALQLGHLELSEVLALIKNKPQNTELVLTGRNAPTELFEVCDYVTEMKCHSHPYNKGILGRAGIDY